MEFECLSKKKKKKTVLDRASKIWLWIAITVFFLVLALIGGSIYQKQKERIRQEKITNLQVRLQELQEQAQRQYYLQDKISTTYLAESPAVYSFFTDLLKTYAEKFAKSKGWEYFPTSASTGENVKDVH